MPLEKYILCVELNGNQITWEQIYQILIKHKIPYEDCTRKYHSDFEVVSEGIEVYTRMYKAFVDIAKLFSLLMRGDYAVSLYKDNYSKFSIMYSMTSGNAVKYQPYMMVTNGVNS